MNALQFAGRTMTPQQQYGTVSGYYPRQDSGIGDIMTTMMPMIMMIVMLAMIMPMMKGITK